MNGAKPQTPEPRLEALRVAYWDRVLASATPEEAPGVPHVLFAVCGRDFAVDARACRGVYRKSVMMGLPGLPAHILGIAGIRGEVISVTDPAHYLALPDARPGAPGYLLLLARGKLKAALWADQVFDVAPLRPEALHPPRLETAGDWRGVVSGATEQDGTGTLVIDAGAYLERTAVGSGGRTSASES